MSATLCSGMTIVCETTSRKARRAFQLSSKVSSSSPKGLGPASTGDHTPAETVDIPSIFRQAKRAALLMSRLAAEKR